MNSKIQGSVDLPGSKSESNRLLMIAAYGGFPLRDAKISPAHDTVLLQQRLRQIATATRQPTVVDCEDAGTATRFLLTYLSCRAGEWVLTGSERMRQRPMQPLVEALRQLGADIEYQGEPGFLPLKVVGRPLVGGKVRVDASQSSQFVSSLLLAAPYWKNGLQLTMERGPASSPYIEMSIAMMQHFGVEVQRQGLSIIVSPGEYQPRPFEVSADWSAASYWYELAALSDECELLLKGLREESLQGDDKVAEVFAKFGVSTRYDAEGAWLTKTEQQAELPLRFHVVDTPDLFPAIFTTCVALHLPAIFQGIQNLIYKESNRVESIITELSKLYIFNNIINNTSINIDKSIPLYTNNTINDIVISTYNDHRVAMALAPLMIRFPHLGFDHPEVVAKSYPGFWEQLKSLLVLV